MNKRVYIVDDDPVYTFSARFMLKKAGLESDPETFNNGKEALDHLLSVKESEIPDLILLDINMPIMDGWEFLESLPESRQMDKIKILMVTSSISREDKEKAKNYDKLSGYLIKPISVEDLTEWLENTD